MSENRAKIAKLQNKIQKAEFTAPEAGLELLPVSHNEFQARWSLNQDTLQSGLQVASQNEEDAHLVLRAYSLSSDSKSSDFSKVWNDYSIDGTDNSGYFTLPTSSAKINAVLGLINQSGRFRPLLRGDAVTLPAAPDGGAGETANAQQGSAPEAAPAPAAVPQATSGHSTPPLNEREVAARLERIAGLPESFKSQPQSRLLPKAGLPAADATSSAEDPTRALPHPLAAHSLEEETILEAVRHRMATDPNPQIPESSELPPVRQEAEHTQHAVEDEAPASEQLASQWEDFWSGNAPIELRAEFVMTGKIAPGMRLLLGNEILEPNPGGFVVWKRQLDSFKQIWPLLESALSSPSVAAGPSLEFFKTVQPGDRMLELHAALEIEGRVTDPAYAAKLPAELKLDARGQFKLSRMLPDGAVILPGLSLIAS